MLIKQVENFEKIAKNVIKNKNDQQRRKLKQLTYV